MKQTNIYLSNRNNQTQKNTKASSLHYIKMGVTSGHGWKIASKKSKLFRLFKNLKTSKVQILGFYFFCNFIQIMFSFIV